MNIFKQIKNLIKPADKQGILLEKIEKINEEWEKIIEEKNRLEKEKIRIEEEKKRAENPKILAEKTKEEEIIFSQLKLIVLRLQDLESKRRKIERELLEERTRPLKELKGNETDGPEKKQERKLIVKADILKKTKKEETEEFEKKSEQKPDITAESAEPEKEIDATQTERSFWEKLEKIKAAEKRRETEVDMKAAAQLKGAKKIAAFLGKVLKNEDEESQTATREKEMIIASTHLAVDFYKDSSEIIIFAQLPGVDIKDLEISLEGQNDIIKIKSRSRRPEIEKTEKEGRFALSECKWPSYYRELNLNEEINVFGIDAKLNAGVLTLRLPILKPGQTRMIKRKIEVRQ